LTGSAVGVGMLSFAGWKLQVLSRWLW